MSSLQNAILQKKAALTAAVKSPLKKLAQSCVEVWPDADQLDRVLQQALDKLPGSHRLYVWDLNGKQLSSLVSRSGINNGWRGRDLSDRPFLKNNLPFKGMMLSSVYSSICTGDEEAQSTAQCVTALQAISDDDELLGFVAADFFLNELLQDCSLEMPEQHWQQYRGDPAVRGTVFMQQRAQSKFDDHIDEIFETITALIIDHGIYHVKIHFFSGRCSFWLLDDPYRYRVHNVEEIIDSDIQLAYPLHTYPKEAIATPAQIKTVMRYFKALRFADETIYLRSASINIMNGLLGLTFSCDGSHYMPIVEFLDKDLSFWGNTDDAEA